MIVIHHGIDSQVKKASSVADIRILSNHLVSSAHAYNYSM